MSGREGERGGERQRGGRGHFFFLTHTNGWRATAKATEAVAADAEAKYGGDSFTVVVQPLMTEATPAASGLDATYLAPDCFHFSGRGHQVGGIGAWRNLLQPVGQKSTTFTAVGTPGAKILCPDQDGIGSFLATGKNSQ